MRARVLAVIVTLLASGCAMGSRETVTEAPDASGSRGRSPHVRYRDRQLEYVGPGRAEAADSSSAADALAIGWYGPSDPSDPLAGDLWLAASMAVRDANDAEDGPSFRLVPAWSEDPWGTGIRLVTRLAYEDRVVALLGSIDGAATHLAEQVVAKARLVLVSPVATDDSVHLAGVPWAFSCAPGDRLAAPLIARGIVESLGSTGELVLLVSTAHDARRAAAVTSTVLEAHGCVPALRLELLPDGADLADRLAPLRDDPPAAVLVVADASESARIVTALRAGGFDGEVWGTAAMGRRQCLQEAGRAVEGVRLPLYFDATSEDAAVRDFVARFTAAAGHAPDWAAAHTWDATRCLIAAIRRAGPNRVLVRDNLLALVPWQGVTGTIVWDGTGQNTRAPSGLAVVRDGRVIKH